jgi:rare lipoprotein A (peptidoglycan hydrolase)
VRWRVILATWYSYADFAGQRTACGQTYTRLLVGLASNALPCGTVVELRFGGVTIRVPVVDRHGHSASDFFDLTQAACRKLRHCWTGPVEWHLAP